MIMYFKRNNNIVISLDMEMQYKDFCYIHGHAPDKIIVPLSAYAELLRDAGSRYQNQHKAFNPYTSFYWYNVPVEVEGSNGFIKLCSRIREYSER